MEAANDVFDKMKLGAEHAQDITLTPEAWEVEFGHDGVVTTPLGEVKMGEHQYLKLLKNKREGYFGMVKPTLERPDIVLEEYDPNDGAECDTKLLFVKTFIKPDGSRYVHFESVTVRRDNMEVSISSHEIQPEAMKKKMQHDKVLHLDNRFLSSEGRLTEPQIEGSDLVPTPSRISSEDKGSDSFGNKQEGAAESSGNRDGESPREDYDMMEAEERSDALRKTLARFDGSLADDVPDSVLDAYADEIRRVSALRDAYDEAFKRHIANRVNDPEYDLHPQDPFESAEWKAYTSALRTLRNDMQAETNTLKIASIMEDGIDGEAVLSGIKPKTRKVKAIDFVGKNPQQPAMTGVYHHDGYTAATDGMVLVDVQEPYDKEKEGKIINKKGDEIEGRYPDIDGIFGQSGLSEIDLDVKYVLGKAQRLATAVKEGKDTPSAYVIIGHTPYDAHRLAKALQIADAYGLDKVRQGGSVLIVEGDKGRIALMGHPVGGMEGRPVYDSATGNLAGHQFIQKMEGAPRRATEAQRRVAKAVTDVMRKAGITVKGRKEMAEVLERMMDEETKTDMEMMSAAKRNPSAKPARDANVSPTVGGGINPRAKVAISDENRKDLTENIDRLHSSVSQGVTAQEFLRLLKKAFGFSDERTRNADISEYVTNAIADDSHTLRLANHHVTASTYKKHNAQANNTAIVIKMSDKRFRGDGSVSLVEFVYFPDRLTPERMHGVIDGLKDWVERGEYTHTDYDDRKVSGRDILLQSTTEGNGERTEFLKTRDGEVYGFVKDGEVYIDETVMDPEVPLHEYTHLWDRAVRKSNPELWRRGKELMRELPLWDEVVNDPAYADIAHDEDLVASEVHSRLTGKDGARKLDEMVAEAERQGDVIAQAKAITLRERVRQWLKDLYGWVRGAFGGKWDKKAVASVTLEEWNAMPLKDLAEGVNDRVELNVASAKDPESRTYMILGEKGAKSLDNRDEATTRMDNLEVARKMEREDKDARAIRIATGWERGADGKWRYEVPDEIEAIKGAVSKFEEYRTMWSERNRMRNEGLTLPSVSLTELDRMVMADSGYGLPLASLMDEDNALFKAYPRLQYINLNVVDEPLSTQAGSFGGGVITLNKGNLADIPAESAFIHEIQHAIQHIEGFAEGGNVKTARDYIKKHRDRAVEAIERTLQEHIDAAKPAWDEVKRINSLEWNDENWSEREAELAQAESEAKRQDETVERWRKFLDTAKRKAWSEISDEEAQEVYRNIAGEVEARNASTRMNFSEDERREKLLEDTEDVAREDQIFLKDNLGESAFIDKRARAVSRETVDERRAPMQMMILGEKGAKALDDRDEASMRMDNLGVARRIEETFSKRDERLEKFNKATQVTIDSELVTRSTDIKEYQKNALDVGKKLRGRYINKDTGTEIEVNKSGLVEVTRHDRDVDAHMQSVAVIPEMIENGIYLGTLPNEDTKVRATAFDYYLCPMRINGVDYVAKMVVADRDGVKYYDHKLTEISRGNIRNLIKGTSTDAEGISSPASSTDALFDGKDKRLFQLLQISKKELAKKIKMATGWERGADGKWRYEVPDLITPYVDLVASIKEGLSLTEVVSDELAEAYPQLRGWHLKFDNSFSADNGETITMATTIPSEKIIRFSHAGLLDASYLENVKARINTLKKEYKKAYDEGDVDMMEALKESIERHQQSYGEESKRLTTLLNKTLVHEIQHVIQELEGFAKGGIPYDHLTPLTRRELKGDQLKSIVREIDELEHQSDVEFAKSEDTSLPKEQRIAALKQSHAILDKVIPLYKELHYEAYRNVAGEVEARNVSSRMNYTDDERRQKLLEETEDVAREDQIFLHDNLGESSSDGLRYRDDKLYLLGDPAETFEDRRKAAVENRGTVMPGLADAEVKIVDVPMHGYTGSIAEATKQAKAAAKEKFAPNGQPRILTYDNFGTSFEYSISGGAIDESLNPKLAKSVANKGVQLAVVEHLDGVIGESIEVEEHADYISKDAQGKRTTDKASKTAIMHRFYGAVECDGVKYRVMTLMRENAAKADANGVHAYEVQKIEVLDAETSSTSNGAGTVEPSVEGQYPVAKLLNGVDKSYDPGKKILDESAKADRETSDVDVRQRAVDKATETAKGLNTQVKVVKAADIKGANDAETARMRSAKGWYDMRTGEITIVEGNISSVDDAVTTVLHETVAHKGLRMLEAGNFPFADSLIQSIRARKKEQEEMQAQQMQMPQGWMLQ